VGYETLVRKIAKQSLDKSSRFTDWSRRPLSDSQTEYALADVTHLRVIYEFLRKKLAETGRDRWVEEEIATLLAPETYVTRPEDAWMRVKTRSNAPRFLALVKELARFREAYAQERNIPRSRVYKDDALVELASTNPRTWPIWADRGCSCAKRAKARSRRAFSMRSTGRKACRKSNCRRLRMPARHHR
jgi:ribonuclease D